MRRRLSAFVSAIVAVVITLVTVAACGGGGGKPPHPAETTADVPVTVAHGATVHLTGGTKLVIPPGAISADGHLIAHTGGAQVGTNLGLDGRPGAAKPVFAAAGNAVTFQLTGAKLVHPASLTVQVDPAAFAHAGSAATRPDAAWLAFYDAAAHRWQPVDSRYDPATHSVTAQVPHLSTWNPFTLDWAGITLRLRQSLSAFGSGRAPATACAKVQGITVTMAGGNDPPLIGCAVERGPDTLTVSMTNNRGISMVMSGVPSDASQDPPSYKGFDEYIATRPNTTHMLGGADLPPSETLTYSLPLHGPPAVFTAAPTLTSYALDLASVIGEDLVGAAKFGKVSGDYATCILKTVARSGPPSFADAPGVAVTCVSALVPALEGLDSPEIKLLQFDAAAILQDYDLAQDPIRGVSGEVDITRAHIFSTSDILALLQKLALQHCQSVSSSECTPGGAKISKIDPRYGVGLANGTGWHGTIYMLPSASSTAFSPVMNIGGDVPSCSQVQAAGVPAAVFQELLGQPCQNVPPQPLPAVYYATAVQPEQLYISPTYPEKLGIDNHDWIAIQSLDAWAADHMTMTGTLHHDMCQPSCASGPMVTYPVQVVATAPQACTLQRYQTGSLAPEKAYVYGKINVRALSGSPPPSLIGNSVFHVCSP